MSNSFQRYANGVRRNTETALKGHPNYTATLETVDEAFGALLEYLGAVHEGVVLFAGMAHASYLSAVSLATSGQLPPAFLVARGVAEDAIYAYYLFHHPELKPNV